MWVYGKDYFLQQDLDPKILSVFAAHKKDFILGNFHGLGANTLFMPVSTSKFFDTLNFS